MFSIPNFFLSRASNPNLNAPKVPRDRSKSQSDSNIKPEIAEGHGLSKTPRVLNPMEFDLIMEYSGKYTAGIPDATKGDLLVELSKKLLDCNCYEKATEFARVVLDVVPEDDKDRRSEAITVMQRAEKAVLGGQTKVGGAKEFEKEMMPYITFLRNGREDLSEMISEKDADFDTRASKFCGDIFTKILAPLCNSVLASLPKIGTKFVVVAFDLNNGVEDRMPYDGVNLGAITGDGEDSTIRHFQKFQTLMKLKVAQLGETAPVLLSSSWRTRYPGLRITASEEFMNMNLIGSVEQFLDFFEMDKEDDYIYQSMMSISPHYVCGDKGLLKKYNKDIQQLLDSQLIVPMAHSGPLTYKEYAFAKLPNKKKLELCEAPVSIRKIKAQKVCVVNFLFFFAWFCC